MTTPVAARPRWLVPVVLAALVAAIVLRFLAFSVLWLDEAQTVDIAHRSLPDLFAALRHDGSPPLYYVLLHGWMTVFGTSTFAVRSLSGVFAVLALPLMWLAARRLGAGREEAWIWVLLLAANPFSIRYATEARMYSLIALLWLATYLLLDRWWAGGPWWSGALGAVGVGAMLLTHYWALFALAAVAIGAVVVALRGDRRGWRLLVPLVVGCLALLPWLGSFLFQLRHTGAPWGAPPSVGKTFDAPTDWAGSGPLGSGTLLALLYYALLVVAVVGVWSTDGVVLRRRLRRPAALMVAVAFGTMFVGTAVTGALKSAYALRYSAIAVAPFLLAVGWGVATLRPPWRNRVLGAMVVIGLIIGAGYPGKTRSQADEAADALAAAAPSDTVVFCPDQLGPAVHRLVPHAGRQVVFPSMGPPEMVDWVDYEKRLDAADPAKFADAVVARTPPGGAIWLVYANDYATLGNDCNDLMVDLSLKRGAPQPVVTQQPGAGEKDNVVRFAP